MAGSPSGQDESNSALWLATRGDKMVLSCSLRTTHHVPQEKLLQSHIINPLLSKLVRSRCWILALFFIFLATLWTSTPSHSKNTLKEKSKETKRKSWMHCLHIFTWSMISVWVKTFETTFFESLFESSFQYYMCSVTRLLNKHQIAGCLYRLLTNLNWNKIY